MHAMEAQSAYDPALASAATSNRLTLRAVGSPEAPRWQVWLACSPGDPDGAPALGFADEFHREQRSGNAGRRPRVQPFDHPPFDIRYWGSLDDPRWVRDMPRTQRVPSIFLGDLNGVRRFEEVRRGLPTRTTRLVRDEEPGFRLARVCGDLGSGFDIDRQRLEDLIASTDTFGEGIFDAATAAVGEELAETVDDLFERATALARHILPGRPQLAFDMMGPEDCIRGHPPRWRVDGWDLGHLSQAQRRWVGLCASLAPHNHPGPPVVFVCDEPEAGLHRAIEHRLAPGLHAMAREVDAAVLVATHSPVLLSSRLVTTAFVTRDRSDGVVVRPLRLSVTDRAAIRESAAELGLTAGDLWSLARVSVVVEGVHDEWVFKNLLGEQLDSAPAGILPMHGGTRLRSLAEAWVLVDGTDAEILVVLDELAHDTAAAALRKVQEAHAAGDTETLHVALDEMRALGKRNDSFLFLNQFAHRAVELGQLDRVSVHGLSLPDLICYLDPATVLLEDRPWDELIAKWTADAAPSPPKNLKGWLRREGLLPDDPRAVDEAIERAAVQTRVEERPIHPDLVALGLHIAELAD